MTVCTSGFIWLWLIVILIASAVECNDDANDELICASVVYRHGNRSIISTYPNDPYKDEKWWPDGFGELNNVIFFNFI